MVLAIVIQIVELLIQRVHLLFKCSLLLLLFPNSCLHLFIVLLEFLILFRHLLNFFIDLLNLKCLIMQFFLELSVLYLSVNVLVLDGIWDSSCFRSQLIVFRLISFQFKFLLFVLDRQSLDICLYLLDAPFELSQLINFLCLSLAIFFDSGIQFFLLFPLDNSLVAHVGHRFLRLGQLTL